jgi:FKBP-type peptidyl-prolyl cis-trans isomerase
MLKSLFINKLWGLLLFLVILPHLQACRPFGEKDEDLQRKLNESIILQYIRDNNLDATKSPVGHYYVITRPSLIGGTLNNFGDRAYIRYTTRLLPSLEVIDDLYQNKDQEVVIGAREVIKGLEEGVADLSNIMRVGEVRKLLIPFSLAFGATSQRGSTGRLIPPFSPIMIDVSLEGIKSEENLIDEYLQAKNISGVVRTASGLRYAVTKVGTGLAAEASSNASVYYKGTFLDGTVFDQTAPNVTFDLNLSPSGSGVVPGFLEAVRLMKVGEKAIFVLPSGLAYRERGQQSQTPGRVSIKPFTPLVFEMELVNVF